MDAETGGRERTRSLMTQTPEEVVRPLLVLNLYASAEYFLINYAMRVQFCHMSLYAVARPQI